jgi:hypothetical protein
MSKKLAYTVVVQERTPLDKDNPARGYSVGRQETFLAGRDDVPDWALPFIGDHAFEPSDDSPAEVSANGSRDADAPAEKPAGNASLEAWQSYAASQSVDVEGKSRDEIRDQFNS